MRRTGAGVSARMVLAGSSSFTPGAAAFNSRIRQRPTLGALASALAMYPSPRVLALTGCLTTSWCPGCAAVTAANSAQLAHARNPSVASAIPGNLALQVGAAPRQPVLAEGI
eukprot:scaffold679_cov374-Prasinococcus_capsulatus_cf.AAC.3